MPQSLLVKEKASQSPDVEEGLQNITINHTPLRIKQPRKSDHYKIITFNKTDNMSIRRKVGIISQ